MRIVMLAHSDATWTPHFASFFASHAHSVLVISFARAELDGADCIDVAFVGAKIYDPNRNKHLFITRAMRVRRLIREFGPDVVFAPYLLSNGLTAVLASHVPVVTSAVGGDVLPTEAQSKVFRLIGDVFVRFISRRAAIVNSVSQRITDRLIHLGVPSAKILQLPFGADVNVFRPGAGMPRPVATRLLCTRKHEQVYHIPTIIDALGTVKASGRPFHCVFTSGGSQLEDHRRRAEGLGLGDNVTFTGHLPYAELPRLLAESDIYISASSIDGTSVALLEAMATGIFPVVSRIAANKPWIDHGRTGLLFDPGKPDELAAALLTAMDDAGLRKHAFEENRLRVDREGNLQRNIEKLMGVLEEVARRHKCC